MHNWLINKMCLFRCVRQLRVTSKQPHNFASSMSSIGPYLSLKKSPLIKGSLRTVIIYSLIFGRNTVVIPSSGKKAHN
jgi:hypothetical protein